jgi:hypothetical protein
MSFFIINKLLEDMNGEILTTILGIICHTINYLLTIYCMANNSKNYF